VVVLAVAVALNVVAVMRVLVVLLVGLVVLQQVAVAVAVDMEHQEDLILATVLGVVVKQLTEMVIQLHSHQDVAEFMERFHNANICYK
jgi:hypothetical protein